MVDQSTDDAAIVALMLKVRRAGAERDFQTLAGCHLHAPYRRVDASRQGVFARQGWDQIGARLQRRQRPACGPPGSTRTLRSRT